jgi:hypothetical protein
MSDSWPEPTDEEFPNDTLPGGPKNDEPHLAAQVGGALEDCGVLSGPGGSEFRFFKKEGTAPDEVEVRWPRTSTTETLEVELKASGTVLKEKNSDRWYRVDYDADRDTTGRWKVSATHGAVVMQWHDGTHTKKWLGST